MESLLLEGLREAAAILMIAIQIPTAIILFFCSTEAANLFGKDSQEITIFEKRRMNRFAIVGCINLVILIFAGTVLYLIITINLFWVYFIYGLIVLVLTLYSLITPK